MILTTFINLRVTLTYIVKTKNILQLCTLDKLTTKLSIVYKQFSIIEGDNILVRTLTMNIYNVML